MWASVAPCWPLFSKVWGFCPQLRQMSHLPARSGTIALNHTAPGSQGEFVAWAGVVVATRGRGGAWGGARCTGDSFVAGGLVARCLAIYDMVA